MEGEPSALSIISSAVPEAIVGAATTVVMIYLYGKMIDYFLRHNNSDEPILNSESHDIAIPSDGLNLSKNQKEIRTKLIRSVESSAATNDIIKSILVYGIFILLAVIFLLAPASRLWQSLSNLFFYQDETPFSYSINRIIVESTYILTSLYYAKHRLIKKVFLYTETYGSSEGVRHKKYFLDALRKHICPECSLDFALNIWETKRQLSAIARMSREKVQVQNDRRVTEKHWTEVRTEITTHSKCCECDYYATKKRTEVTKESQSSTTY